MGQRLRRRRETIMQTTRRDALAALAALVCALSPAAYGKGKHHHKDGKKLLGPKIKSNGNHVVDKNGATTVSFDVRDGKIAGMKARHEKKGDLAVKKYKSKKKMVAQAASGLVAVQYLPAQDTYLGSTWIGYAYIDEWGDEQIYWVPYDMVLDGDTGAVEYIPV
jgi:hypothetical protein